jgi:hypothetical protein
MDVTILHSSRCRSVGSGVLQKPPGKVAEKNGAIPLHRQA